MQRYEEFAEIIKTEDGKRRYASLYYPRFQLKSTDIYLISKKNDRLDLLAYRYYGDSRFWIIIAKANKLHNATLRVPVGIRLRIPYPLPIDELSELFNEAQF